MGKFAIIYEEKNIALLMEKLGDADYQLIEKSSVYSHEDLLLVMQKINPYPKI